MNLYPIEKTDEFGRAVSPIKFGYVQHMDGPFVIEPKFDFADEFTDEIAPGEGPLARVKVGDKWGIIRPNGTYFIEPQFRNIRDFHEGIAAVSVDHEYYKDWGYIKLDGTYLVPPMFDYAEDFHDGYGKVQASSETRGFLQPNGSYALRVYSDIADRITNIKDFDDVNIVGKGLNGKTGYVDTNGYWHNEK